MLLSSRPRAVGTPGQSTCEFSLRLFYSCWSQHEPVLPLAFLSAPCFPCCALHCCRGSIWELLTCRPCESQLRSEEITKRTTQAVLRDVGESLGRPCRRELGDMTLLNMLNCPWPLVTASLGWLTWAVGQRQVGGELCPIKLWLVFCALLMPCCPKGNVIPSPACQAPLPCLWLWAVLLLYPIPTVTHAAESQTSAGGGRAWRDCPKYASIRILFWRLNR